MRFKTFVTALLMAGSVAVTSARAEDPAADKATAGPTAAAASDSAAPAAKGTSTKPTATGMQGAADKTALTGSDAPVAAGESAPAANSNTPASSTASANAGKTLAPAVADVVIEPIGPEVVQRAKAIADKTGGKSIDKADLAALNAYYAAFPGKPLWVEGRMLSPRATAVMAEIGRAGDWGLNAADYKLPSGTIGPDRDTLTRAEAMLTLAALRYARDARGGRMDTHQLSEAIDRDPPIKDPTILLGELAASDAPDSYLRKLHPQHEQFERLRRLYVSLKAGKTIDTAQTVEDADAPKAKSSKKRSAKAPSKRETISADRVLLNMEQWRWMPEQLGSLYINVNLPEFQIRVVKDGKVIHQERAIVGEVSKPTPIFSQNMQSVVFHPGWGVPNSIKVNELLPGLLRGRDTLTRNGLRATYKGQPVDPTSIDWTTTDIRSLNVIQPPGGRNVLGVVKFQFPNKHDIYMHDTPEKSLFNSSVRTFSHGCMRIRNPVKLAEVIFRETAGWSSSKVAGLVKGGPMDNRVSLQRQIPVHITYFTVTVGDDGKPNVFRDVYGHEKKIRMGLDGKAHLIVKKTVNLSAARARVLSSAGSASGFSRSRDRDWTNNVFGMN